MKKFLSLMIISTMFVFGSLKAFADDSQEALQFFNSYVTAANTYSQSLPGFYSPSAKIIRQVVKPNGELVNVYTNTSTYIKQMKLSQTVAKTRHYTNSYSNVTVTPVANGGYKVSSLRQPKGETYKLKTYMIVKKQPNGKWLITEELMQTKEQIFLKYANKK